MGKDEMKHATMQDRTDVIAAVLSYSFCSGTLVLLNKLILHHFPFPSFVVTFQLITTVLFIYAGKYYFGLPVDELKWKYIVPYLYYIIAFSLGVYCNMKSLSISNVETVIVFRALSPCLVAFLDAIFLGREYPSVRSWLAMITIVAGTYGYALHDPQFQSQGITAYVWPFFYLLIISFEMAYGKQIIRSVDLKTNSGPVLYTNILGIIPMLFLGVLAGEPSKFHTDRGNGVTYDPVALLFLLLGCAAAIGIGYSSWWCRDKVSATSFTLIGVMNKCLTILLNFFIWDQHAPVGGIACLALCLVGGAVYQQAPLRSVTSPTEDIGDTDDVWDKVATDSEDNDEKESLVTLSGIKHRAVA